jgi:hypothetical protein
MFFPPDLREWLPENHLVYFIVDIIERLDLQSFKINHAPPNRRFGGAWLFW